MTGVLSSEILQLGNEDSNDRKAAVAVLSSFG
jgi:hypothetical protein